MSDSLFGIKFEGGVVLAANASAAFSVLRIKDDEDRIMEIDDNKLIACAGPAGDFRNFLGMIKTEVELHKYQNHGTKMPVEAMCKFVRSELAYCLRKGPYQVDMLMAGHDEVTGNTTLKFCDYLAGMQEVNKGAHGYGAMFTYGLMDRYWKPKMTEAEALDLIEKCIEEMRVRFLLNSEHFKIKVVTAQGIKHVEQRKK